MESSTRYALIVGVRNFNDPGLPPLPGAEADVLRVHSFLSDSSRGSVNPENITVLKSPTLADLKEAIADILFRASNVEKGLALLYFATHAKIFERQGVQIMASDSDLNHRTKTSLSTIEIANFIAEYRPASTILILDVCQAGGHVAGAAELALNELWQDSVLKESALADGHFILGACMRKETAAEDVMGGCFTSLMLNQIEVIGSQRPYEKNLTVETIAGAITKTAVESGWSQHPAWSGLSVSKPIFLSANPHWSESATIPPDTVPLAEISQTDRQALSSQAQAQWSASNLIGYDPRWASHSIDVLWSVIESAASDEAKQLFIARISQNIFDRVAAYGNEKDLAELLGFVEAAIVSMARANGLYSKELRGLALSISKLAQKVLSALEAWTVASGWIVDRDGPAAIGLAPIRFWDTLGQASLVALACRVARDSQSEAGLVAMIAEVVRNHTDLHRVTWAGQYPDLTATLGYLMWKDAPLARECIRNILARFIDDASKGYRPIETTLAPRELGLALANYFMRPTEDTPPRYTEADEFPALGLLLLKVAGESDFSLNVLISELSAAGGMGSSYYLYEPGSVTSQFVKTMTDCAVKSWVRSSLKSAADMLSTFPQFYSAPFDLESQELPIELLASAAAGRYFRNRSVFGLAKGIRYVTEQK